jgi:hypothetical protein
MAKYPSHITAVSHAEYRCNHRNTGSVQWHVVSYVLCDKTASGCSLLARTELHFMQ